MPLLGNRGLFGGLFDGFRPHPGGDPKIRAMGGGFGGLFGGLAAPFRGVFGGMFPGAGIPGFPNTGGFPGGYPAMGGFRGDGFSPGGFAPGYGPGAMNGFAPGPFGLARSGSGNSYAPAFGPQGQTQISGNDGGMPNQNVMLPDGRFLPAGSPGATAYQTGAASVNQWTGGLQSNGRFGPTGVDYGAYGAARGFGNAPYVPPGTSYTGLTGNQAPYGSNYTPASSFVDNNASTPTNYSPSGGGGNMGAVQQARRR